MFRSFAPVDWALSALELPSLYRVLLRNSECTRSAISLARDLLELHLGYKTFPDHYRVCRLWEVPRSCWKYYYGSNYHAYQRAALTREVQPREYNIIFEDKLICERLCAAVGVRMPKTLGLLGVTTDYRSAIGSLLCEGSVAALIIKPLRGASGRGIVVARRDGDRIRIRMSSGEVLLESFILPENAIAQEVVEQDQRMKVFSVNSLNTIRVVTMLTKNDEVIILGATLRCGVGMSYVDNWSAGGVAAGVDAETGVLHKYAFDRQGNRYVRHPTTGVRFEGFAVPSWPRIVEAAIKVQRFFGCYRLLGLDIGLAEGGDPVLIEVNNNTDLLFQEQTSGPLLRREAVLRAFGDYGLLVNKHQRKLYMELRQ